MSPDQNNCLNFVADLRRAVHCISNGNYEGAKTFLDHAEKILSETKMSDDLQIMWRDLYNMTLPTETLDAQQFSDKLLTLSSIIFSRTMNYVEH